jgi:hypothetical protein
MNMGIHSRVKEKTLVRGGILMLVIHFLDREGSASQLKRKRQNARKFKCIANIQMQPLIPEKTAKQQRLETTNQARTSEGCSATYSYPSCINQFH